MPSPYILPSTLVNAPTGISWATIPQRGASSAAQLAEQWNICRRATSWIDGVCNQVLRATVDVEEEDGPGHSWFSVNRQGVATMRLRFWPVISLIGGNVGLASAFPRAYTPIAANLMDVSTRAPHLASGLFGSSGVGPASVRVAPGQASWYRGRDSYRLQVTYLSGWPHAGITAAAFAGATTLSVDDVSGFTLATPSAPIVAPINAGANTETASVIAATPVSGSGLTASGPGTLTLAAGLMFPHAGPTDGIPTELISTLPEIVESSALLYAKHFALMRGSTATGVQTQPGAQTSRGEALLTEARELLGPLTRTMY